MSQTGVGRKLGRKRGARAQLLRGLATDLFRYEQIRTTVPKAKEASRLANHLISVAKGDSIVARRKVAQDIKDELVFKKLFDVLIQRYTGRTGGYTQIFRLQSRQGDNAEMALLKLIA